MRLLRTLYYYYYYYYYYYNDGIQKIKVPSCPLISPGDDNFFSLTHLFLKNPAFFGFDIFVTGDMSYMGTVVGIHDIPT